MKKVLAEKTNSDEFVLFNAGSNGWDRYMPVTFIRYDDGSMDLHCQTGDHHREAIRYAKKMLNNLGLSVSRSWFGGPTGIYYSVYQRGLKK